MTCKANQCFENNIFVFIAINLWSRINLLFFILVLFVETYLVIHIYLIIQTNKRKNCQSDLYNLQCTSTVPR